MFNKVRFTMVVSEFRFESDQFCFTGLPFEEFSDVDTLYIRRSNLPHKKITVKKTNRNGDLMEIYTDIFACPKDLQFAVITNVAPQETYDPKVPIENPFLLGLAREYKERFTDKKFLNEICYAFIHAKFIVPVVTKTPDETDRPADGKQVAFHIFTTEKGNKTLPLFTDFGSILKWKTFKESTNLKIGNLSFNQICEIAKPYDGIILNAFDIGIVIPNAFLKSILDSDGYKRDKEAPNPTVEIGVPAENENIKLIKSAMIDFCSENDKIKEGYLFLTKDNDKISFLVVYDLDLAITEEERNQIFRASGEKLAPIIIGKVPLQFAMKAPHFIKLCNQYEPVYKAE